VPVGRGGSDVSRQDARARPCRECRAARKEGRELCVALDGLRVRLRCRIVPVVCRECGALWPANPVGVGRRRKEG
jgi:hypothetical protein